MLPHDLLSNYFVVCPVIPKIDHFLQEQVSSLQRQLTHRQLDKDKQEDSGTEAGKILAEAKHILAEAKREAAELETVTANERDKLKHAITMKVAHETNACKNIARTCSKPPWISKATRNVQIIAKMYHKKIAHHYQ